MNDDFGIPTLSDGLLRRDSFFHSCWLELKNQRPDLFELTNRIELKIAGYDPGTDKAETDGTDLEIL